MFVLPPLDNCKPIKIWLKNPNDLEGNCLGQAQNLSGLPMLHKHVALMPDTHAGMGMPIGGVIALHNAIIPNAVGVDIGCGMCAVKSNITFIPPKETREYFIKALKVKIPVGFDGHKEPCDDSEMPNTNIVFETCNKAGLGIQNSIVHQEYNAAKYKLGTLGGGNHFLELQVDEQGFIWLMIHSGSRNIGKKICDYYNELAQEFHKEWFIDSPPMLAWLPANSKEGKMYLAEMNYALEYAFKNRQKMMYRAMDIFKNIMKKCHKKKVGYIGQMDNIHHNYASLENHFGDNVWVHRKGATLARKGTVGIIPGSMGTKSYIVEGLGNKESFESCSHGAGRVMGRSEYNKTHILANVKKELGDVVHSGWSKDRQGKLDLSEAPSAYKDIDTVMENQKDLVKIMHELKPLAVLKG